MNVTKQSLVLSVLALALASCSDDNPWQGPEGTGRINLTLKTDGHVKEAIPVLTRAEADDVPEISDFGVTLTKNSTLESSEYGSLDEFNTSEAVPVGTYTVAAVYGDVYEEGFELPCYYGEAEVTVLDSQQSDVEVVATLASTMVSIDYTDKFKEHFQDYGVTVHTPGNSFVEFANDETRPAYLAPGEVAIAVDVTTLQGNSATLQPTSFNTDAAHHYRVTLGVHEGNVGQEQLVITFDDSLDKEDIYIDLSDELFTSAAPTVNPIGFVDGQLFETIEGVSLPDAIKYNISAPAGFESVMLTVDADNFNLFPREIDLCKATPTEQANLAAAGVKVLGLWGNQPDKYAVVDVTGLATKLPAGAATVTLLAKDKFTRISEPVSVKFSSVPIVIDVTSASAVLGGTSAKVTVDYNGADADDITFQAMDKNGVYRDCEKLSTSRNMRTRAAETKTYNFEISLPDTDRPEIPIKVFVCGVEKVKYNVPVSGPQYSVQTDAFSKFAAIKIVPQEASQLNMIASGVKVFLNGSAVDESRLNRNATSGIITIAGLQPATEYNLQTSIYPDGGASGPVAKMTTESGAKMPNGDFAETEQTINMQNVWVGGEWTATALNNPAYHITTNIVRSMPTGGWTSINAKTCYTGASNINTWFCVPSTYVENGKVVVRSVGYNHNGSTPGKYKKTGVNYNGNAPEFADANKIAGELFLGSYTFNGSETRTDGIAFNCRPSTLTFQCSYAPYGSEKGSVYVAILDASKNVLASGTAEIAAGDTSKTIKLSNYKFGVKAAYLQVRFLSSTAAVPGINVPSGSGLNEGYGVVGNHKNADNVYKAVATGSVLTLDNVTLNY